MPKINLKNILEQFANICGLDSRFDNIYQEMPKPDNTKCNSYTSFSELCSYRYYDKINNVIVLDDSHIGSLIELTPLVGFEQNIAKELENLLANIVPQNMYLQVMMIASPIIDPIIRFWRFDKADKRDVIQKILNEREYFLRQKSTNFVSGERNLPRDFRLYISINQKCPNQNARLLFHNFQKLFLTKLSSIGLCARLCDADDLINLVNENVKLSLKEKASMILNNSFQTK